MLHEHLLPKQCLSGQIFGHAQLVTVKSLQSIPAQRYAILRVSF
jgi:hypothetical protein